MDDFHKVCGGIFHLVNGVSGCGNSSEICSVATEKDLIAVVSTGGRDDLQAMFTKASKQPTQVCTLSGRVIRVAQVRQNALHRRGSHVPCRRAGLHG